MIKMMVLFKSAYNPSTPVIFNYSILIGCETWSESSIYLRLVGLVSRTYPYKDYIHKNAGFQALEMQTKYIKVQSHNPPRGLMCIFSQILHK